jgi:hypothetical protein
MGNKGRVYFLVDVSGAQHSYCKTELHSVTWLIAQLVKKLPAFMEPEEKSGLLTLSGTRRMQSTSYPPFLLDSL